MSWSRTATAALAACTAVAACSSQRNAAPSAEEPWGHAYAGSPDGWWVHWYTLDDRLPYGEGTRFVTETLGPHGIRHTEVITVIAIKPEVGGRFTLTLESSNNDGYRYRASVPRDLPSVFVGQQGSITARNEHLYPVTVPAGTFDAGRTWKSERQGTYERDEWVVGNLPVPVQTWSRPANATDLYNPPAGDDIPEDTELTRLVRIEKGAAPGRRE